MKRISLFLLPLALVAAAFAQDAKSPPKAEDLVKQLGHDDYAVRESATKKLIELGDAAVPALEQALKSDDLEVRLRAGRALRAIQGKGAAKKDAERKADKAKPGVRDPLGPGGRVIGTSLSINNGKVKVKVTRLDKNGKKSVKEYEGTSVEELKKKYPELKDVLGNFRVMTSRDALKGLRFDMDKFWKDFGKEFDKDFWKNWQKDIESEAKRLDELSRRWAKQLEQLRKDPWGNDWRRLDNRWVNRGSRLGATATKPSRVLAAQLGLRGNGIVIETVMANSVAAALGLQRYDILMELNGTPIRDHGDVAVALKDHKQGAKVTAKVIRRAVETKLETK